MLLLFVTVSLMLHQVSLGAKIGSIDSTRCSTCANLLECKALNGIQIPDRIVGYTREETRQLTKQGVCMDMDKKAQATRLFGPEFQFKDTLECRDLVNRYNCLAWASKNNTCPKKAKVPCRSLCVEVADKCVFTHLYRSYLDTVCGRIPCDSIVEKVVCEPGAGEGPGFDRCDLRDYVPIPGELSGAHRAGLSLAHFFIYFVSYYSNL